MLHEAMFLQLATQQCENNCPCNIPFSQLAMQQNVALQVARKVELSSTFRNVAKQVVACNMSAQLAMFFIRHIKSDKTAFDSQSYKVARFHAPTVTWFCDHCFHGKRSIKLWNKNWRWLSERTKKKYKVISLLQLGLSSENDRRKDFCTLIEKRFIPGSWR